MVSNYLPVPALVQEQVLQAVALAAVRAVEQAHTAAGQRLVVEVERTAVAQELAQERVLQAVALAAVPVRAAAGQPAQVEHRMRPQHLPYCPQGSNVVHSRWQRLQSRQGLELRP